ncbi:hypothetical protein F5Y18DRAFT_103472 [Xylariaceae sp. FL1019]|nr:hypothetical protein F5Y18DRAFT_103472 [Xylariaceae sp. FL1019]
MLLCTQDRVGRGSHSHHGLNQQDNESCHNRAGNEGKKVPEGTDDCYPTGEVHDKPSVEKMKESHIVIYERESVENPEGKIHVTKNQLIVFLVLVMFFAIFFRFIIYFPFVVIFIIFSIVAILVIFSFSVVSAIVEDHGQITDNYEETDDVKYATSNLGEGQDVRQHEQEDLREL